MDDCSLAHFVMDSLPGVAGQCPVLGASLLCLVHEVLFPVVVAGIPCFSIFNAVCLFSSVVQAAGAVLHLIVLAWGFSLPF